jgi:hypothetical protein
MNDIPENAMVLLESGRPWTVELIVVRQVKMVDMCFIAKVV